MDSTFRRWLTEERRTLHRQPGEKAAHPILPVLEWLPEHGMGFLPIEAAPSKVYDAAYFAKYEGYAATDLGRELTRQRVDFCRASAALDNYSVLDVGIGCGQFVQALRAERVEAFGYDISDTAMAWLRDRGFYRSPYGQEAGIHTYWDSLEHLQNPTATVRSASRFVFVSLPIFRDVAHVIASKHFRPDEHMHYWTEEGIERWFEAQGFKLLAQSNFEAARGREDIMSYAFRRRSADR